MSDQRVKTNFQGFVRLQAYHFYRLAWAGLDWIYPPRCGGCGRPSSRWCTSCQNRTYLLAPPICQVCGCEIHLPGVCNTCRSRPPSYAGLRSWAYYDGPLRDAIHRLKYYGDMALADVLSQPLIAILCELEWSIDLIVPVPMTAAHYTERGYNQAALLAFPVAIRLGIPYKPGGLKKVRHTPSQVGLNMEQRVANVRDAFKGISSIVRDKCVLIIDDVLTSGATFNACVSALMDAAAKQVYGLTLARAAYRNPAALVQ